MVSSYLEKHAIRPKLLKVKPTKQLGLIIVIPSFNESQLLRTLKSIQSCQKPSRDVEVIVVFNASQSAESSIKQRNIKTSDELIEWYNQIKNPLFQFHFLMENNLEDKIAGVGVARKIGMDEAVRRFHEVENEKGILCCFDADSQCDPNYLLAIEAHFEQFSKIGACSIYFEHPLEGEEFPDEIYQGILWYEMHLRYYKQGLAFAQLPFAFHAIGSSMAVKTADYCKQGGMNKRKAGEDFYFLQKFIDHGLLNELNSTRLIPSPRSSERVPFGTGRAILEMLNGDRNIQLSYSFRSFQLLKSIFFQVSTWYEEGEEIAPIFIDFVGEENWKQKLAELRKHSTSSNGFEKRFFQWFNGFKCLKFIHYLRDHFYPLSPLDNEVPQLLNAMGQKATSNNPKNLLFALRKLDRGF